MSKGKPLGSCKTCKSEIVEFVNEGVFPDGECEACEYLRYQTQPGLLAALTEAREYVAVMLESSGADDGERKLLRRFDKIIRAANGQSPAPASGT